MKDKNILPVLVIIILIFLGIFFFDKTYSNIQKINPENYEKTSEGYLSKETCGNNDYCKKEFNEYWECQIINKGERCICVINDEKNFVCGKDGKTYRNPSELNCLGVEIGYYGGCKKASQNSESRCEKCGNGCVVLYPGDSIDCSPATENFECKKIGDECEKFFK